MAVGILAGIKALFGDGGIVKTGLDFVNKRWPPNMSESDRKQMEIVVSDMLHQQEMQLLQFGQEQQVAFDQRIKDMEGTAADLRAVPFFGTLILFLRGTQRPIWGFATLYLDFYWFTSAPTFTEQQQTALIVINILVLTFLFGERAIKNLEPLIMKVFGGKNGA